MSTRWRPIHRLLDLPIPVKVNLVVAIFVLIIVALISIGYGGMEVVSGVRAYVGGEGLWSKSQKQALYFLTKYARSRDDADYQSYLRAVSVPLGDKKARLELEKPEPRYDVVYRGFAEGRNHADDHWIMARLFRWLSDVDYFRRAVAIWTEADSVLGEVI